MNGSNDVIVLIVLGILGLLAFFKPILIYNAMKNGSRGISPLNLFTMGVVYILLAVAVIKLYYARPHTSLICSIVLFLLGLWNIYFGFRLRKLKNAPKIDSGDNDPEEKDNPETKA